MQISSKNVCDICVNPDAGRRRELAPVKLVAWRSQGQLQEKEESKCDQNHTGNKRVENNAQVRQLEGKRVSDIQ